ncbi:relaxase/mobilization nuclease domain-containing protein [Mucilaginibacter aquaedulcis]|uniref:relaxase/mobilization nuclease domain-containing protein n=1 Tax=Mucilaginibacter aquaedulcis TaxID=1187081 RepID=UPI0025B4610D|nr:relaxase/mobilization nuclease domain-containing protein [Mucilaginibacter aquaedulcis]MDN3548793.1 relaxase/mobilization nuclease domain-containing protein [Mucilaginibacter aquaedulcis]
MVAVIHQSTSLRNILNYNEQKVKAGLAVCLEAGFYPVDAADLNFNQKLRRLEMLTELNQRTKYNSVHISLNFDPSEKLPDDVLREIAEVYLDKLGFVGQPYLLYRHEDAGHPHLHMVTTNIQPDGKAIHLHNLGKRKSEPARKELEIRYGLMKAEESKLQRTEKLKPVNAARVLYGKSETKRAIYNVLQTVLPLYKYASLAELNALLRQYNIVADRGEKNSRIFRHSGLVYRVLDEQGNKVGVPIKASLFFKDTTLKFLEGKFEENKVAKEDPKAKLRLKNAIDLYFLGRNKSLEGLVGALKRQGVDTIIRRNEEGLIYGITYVDHQSKCVFNGSNLGKAYSANAIRERCLNIAASEGKKQNGEVENAARDGHAIGVKERDFSENWSSHEQHTSLDMPGLAEVLLEADGRQRAMDWEFKRKRKKRKRMRLSTG